MRMIPPTIHVLVNGATNIFICLTVMSHVALVAFSLTILPLAIGMPILPSLAMLAVHFTALMLVLFARAWSVTGTKPTDIASWYAVAAMLNLICYMTGARFLA